MRRPLACQTSGGAYRAAADTTRFTATRTQVDGPLVTVARLSPEKDIDTLIRAIALAGKRSPGIRLEIAGDQLHLAGMRLEISDKL